MQLKQVIILLIILVTYQTLRQYTVCRLNAESDETANTISWSEACHPGSAPTWRSIPIEGSDALLDIYLLQEKLEYLGIVQEKGKIKYLSMDDE